MTALLDRLDWGTLAAMAASALRIALIVAMAWLAVALAQRGVRALRLRVATRLQDGGSVQRAETVGRVVRYVVTVVVSLVAGMLVLGELGVSAAPILGAAGVVGLAVGFGAQSLVKDYFTGFFLLVEDQLRQGDVVKLGEHAGLVEQVTLRYVQLRDYDGHVHYVPNSLIAGVVNMGRGHAQAVLDVPVADEMRRDPMHAARILDDLEMAGVERWDTAAVVIRARIRVRPLEQWNVRREFLGRLKKAFERAGVEIPFPFVAVPLRS